MYNLFLLNSSGGRGGSGVGVGGGGCESCKIDSKGELIISVEECSVKTDQATFHVSVLCLIVIRFKSFLSPSLFHLCKLCIPSYNDS